MNRDALAWRHGTLGLAGPISTYPTSRTPARICLAPPRKPEPAGLVAGPAGCLSIAVAEVVVCPRAVSPVAANVAAMRRNCRRRTLLPAAWLALRVMRNSLHRDLQAGRDPRFEPEAETVAARRR